MVNFGLNSASVLAQVNFGTNSASLLGIVLAVAGAALYFLRTVRPELSRDHDIFFAAVGLLCGFIFIFQGWRLDPILQFGQVLLTGATIFFAVESIRLRGAATELAKRNTPIVDEERPVSRVYRAELDELEPEDEEIIPRRQIRPSRDTRSTRTTEYDDEAPRRNRRNEYDDEPPRRSSTRSSSAERLGSGDRARKQRSSRPVSRSPIERPEEDEWGSPKRSDDDWDTSSGGVSKPSRGSNASYSTESRNPDVASKPKRRRRPSQASVSQRESDVEATPTDYVDYKPVDQPDDDPDNSANFDER